MADTPAVKKTITFKQFKVHCPKDDYVTIPLFHNKWIAQPDITWVTPSSMFYQKVSTACCTRHGDVLHCMWGVKHEPPPTTTCMCPLLQVLGDGIIKLEVFDEKVEAFGTRDATQAELKILQKHAFIAPNPLSSLSLVQLDKLASMLKLLPGLTSTVACLEDLPPLVGSHAGRGNNSMFPDTIPQCTLGEEELQGPYSLSATANHLAAYGTKWDKQLGALEKFKTTPPLSSHGRATKVGSTSLELMMRSLDEYMGYAYKHHGVEPSMDLVMQPNMFSKFMAFKLARDNVASTMLRSAQQVSLVVTFVVSGHCPQVQTWAPGHVAQVKQWYSNLKGGYRQEAASAPVKRSAISLSDQWDAVDDAWTQFKDDFQVGGCLGSSAGLLAHALTCIPPCHITHTNTPFPHSLPQANGYTWNEHLAELCHHTGLKVLLSGRYQPPVRIGALRVCHQYGKVDGVNCVECG